MRTREGLPPGDFNMPPGVRAWMIPGNGPEEPDYDDSVHYCPDCEKPNQFGELCESCRQERQLNQDLNDEMI